jgi:hypothetical protein
MVLRLGRGGCGCFVGDAEGTGDEHVGFRDLDGHQWSFIHMDLSAFG